MSALTPEERLTERLNELEDLRRRTDLEVRRIKAALRRTNPNGRPPNPRPPCGTPKGYQRHYREGEHCEPCLAAHRRQERARYAARKLAESPVGTRLPAAVDSAALGTIGAQVKTAPTAEFAPLQPGPSRRSTIPKGA